MLKACKTQKIKQYILCLENFPTLHTVSTSTGSKQLIEAIITHLINVEKVPENLKVENFHIYRHLFVIADRAIVHKIRIARLGEFFYSQGHDMEFWC